MDEGRGGHGRMIPPDGVSVSLRFLQDDFTSLRAQVVDDLASARLTAAALDSYEARTTAIRRRLGLPATAFRPPASSGRGGPVKREAQRASVQARLRQRGVDVDAIDLDTLLDPAEIARIERRHAAGFEVRTGLDAWDVAAAVCAGVIGTIVDTLVVGTPGRPLWPGMWSIGDPLTARLRSLLAVDHDNRLAPYALVPFDRVTGTALAMAPSTHRVQTFGHDPLLGLVVGVMDIMSGSLTGVAPGAGIKVTATLFEEAGFVEALAVELLHLLSDVGTAMGLPLPGWTALLLANFGAIGPGKWTVAQVARSMYTHGYDSWHFLSMATSTAAVEAVCRGYFALRRAGDDDYNRDVEAEAARAVCEAVSDFPRYQAVSLLAHSVAAAGNLGKLALLGGNPLALNYTQWLTFAGKLFGALARPASPDPLAGQAAHNLVTIETGWARIGLPGQALSHRMD